MPDIAGGLGIAQGQEGGDGTGQLAGRTEATLAQIESDVAEEALHQIQPGAGRWCEVQVETLVPFEPRLHGRMLVRGVVIHDQVQL
ncbi:hypothetical protein D9M68_864950 [compost metagenome]